VKPTLSGVNVERIRKHIEAGFRPFGLRTSDGREYDIRHPETILFGRHSVAVLDKDGEITTLDPLHIVAIKDLPAKSNGKR
jgi:hypothetical protein